ncbi:carboxylate--amine ligase [Sphingobium aquiterrae]|uniref:carboxylate--amine ligase n=1 Tax=Sphingobium aquiterrae TaxID=2038656 RepID=UPI0030159DE7
MTDRRNVIVLGVDTPIGLTVVRELGAHGLHVHGIGRSPDAIGRASRYCASFSMRPEGRALADWLPGRIAETGAGALVAISEGDLLALAAMPEVVAGCKILTPRAGPLGLVLDKSRTLEVADSLGLSVPESWLPLSGQDHPARAATLSYPVVLKWPDPPAVMDRLDALGIPFVKAEFATDAQQLRAILARYAPLGVWPLVQRYCPGVGLGQMIHMAGGEPTLLFQHRRLHEWPPEGGTSTLCRAEPLARHRTQMDKSVALLRAIGWEGPAMVEYRLDEATGTYWLMEVNGRFWGSLPLASHCGAHFAWELWRRAMQDGPCDPAPPPRAGLQARYMVPETRRLLRTLFRPGRIADPFFRRRPLRDLARYMLGFLDPRSRYYVWSLRDPAPFFSDVGLMLRKAARRGMPRQG